MTRLRVRITLVLIRSAKAFALIALCLMSAAIPRLRVRLTRVSIRCTKTFVIIALYLVGAIAWADEPPRTQVRAHLEPSGTIVAGGEVKLVVDVLTTTYFVEAPGWPQFTIPDAVVSLPDENATNLSETIDGVRWFGVSRSYRIAPQASKTFDVPAISIPVHPGGIDTPVVLTTSPLKFTATLPPGAEGMRTFFATSALSATQTLAPDSRKVHVGDTLTRTVVQRASGTQAMLLPPVVYAEVAGTRLNVEPGSTHDVTDDRAGLVACERTDHAGYVVQQSGHLTLPPITIDWWNTQTHQRESIVLPALTLSVTAAAERPVFEIPVQGLAGGLQHRILVIDRSDIAIGVGVIVALIAMAWLWPRLVVVARRLKHAAQVRRARYAQSDAHAWMALRAALRHGSLAQIIPALYVWLDRHAAHGSPARIENLLAKAEAEDAHEHNDKADTQTLMKIGASIQMHYAPNDHVADPTGSRGDWVTALARVRHTRQKGKKADSALPPLNPF